MSCQPNNAAHVKINTPPWLKVCGLGYFVIAHDMLIESDSSGHVFKKVLAIDLCIGVFIFTYETRFDLA